MSKRNPYALLKAGLEDFTEGLNDSITSVQAPQEVEVAPELQAEGQDFDDGVDELSGTVQALEDVLALVQDAPGEEDAPIEGFVQKAVNVALEANELTAIGNDQTKKSFSENTKAVIQKVLKAILEMASKIKTWILQIWARSTDSLTKNINWAKKQLATIENLPTDTTRKIEDEAVLKAIATADNTEVGQALINSFDFAHVQAEKGSKVLTEKAKDALGLFARSGYEEGQSKALQELNEVFSASGSTYAEEAKDGMLQAMHAPEGAIGFVSEPFFGGMRAWMVVPGKDDIANITQWNHGISALEEAKPQAALQVPGSDEMLAICKTVITGSDLIAFYRAELKRVEDLDRAVSQLKGVANKNLSDEAAKQFRVLGQLAPKIIKGPQVAAYNYAVSASSIALRYVQAAIKVHGQKETAAA